MNRRSFLSTTAATAVTAVAADAALAQAPKAPKASNGSKAPAGPHADVVRAATACLAAAYACREMCVATLQTGDTMMAACMRTISDMIPLCEATAQLAASKSKHLQKTAAACIDACVDCEAECRKHAGHHAECKACADACAACIAACKRVA